MLIKIAWKFWVNEYRNDIYKNYFVNKYSSISWHMFHKLLNINNQGSLPFPVYPLLLFSSIFRFFYGTDNLLACFSLYCFIRFNLFSFLYSDIISSKRSLFVWWLLFLCWKWIWKFMSAIGKIWLFISLVVPFFKILKVLLFIFFTWN